MNNMNIFQDKIKCLLLCIKYSTELHHLVNNITINSRSQGGILNHLYLFPCPQSLTLSSNLIDSAFDALLPHWSAQCFFLNVISFHQKTEQLTKTVS